MVHSLTDAPAAADITQMKDLLHDEDRAILENQAYWKEADR